MRLERDTLVQDLKNEGGISHKNNRHVEEEGDCTTNHPKGLDCSSNFCACRCTYPTK